MNPYNYRDRIKDQYAGPGGRAPRPVPIPVPKPKIPNPKIGYPILPKPKIPNPKIGYPILLKPITFGPKFNQPQPQPYDITALPNYNPALPFSGLTPEQQTTFAGSSDNHQYGYEPWLMPGGGSQKTPNPYNYNNQVQKQSRNYNIYA